MSVCKISKIQVKGNRCLKQMPEINSYWLIKRSDAPEGKDKEQTFVGLSSEDEELLNQKLPGVSTTFNTENGAEKKVDYSVKWIGPLKDLLAMGIIMVKDKVKNL